MGLAVDANVLIFERIKEEMRTEKSNIHAFDIGYKRAQSAILDANITTLIASLLLFVFDTTPIENKVKESIYNKIQNKSILFDKVKYPWFIKEYNQYNPSINELNGFDYENINIKIFMGTWCHDSKREIPRLIKILDNLKFSESKIDIIALTKDKKGYFKDYSKYKVLNTPTIIFYLDNNEIGRIIEKPKDSLEAAISLIIKDE